MEEGHKTPDASSMSSPSKQKQESSTSATADPTMTTEATTRTEDDEVARAAATADDDDNNITTTGDTDGLDCKDVLKELYYYVIRERNVVIADEGAGGTGGQLTVGHVVQTLKEEGIWFWRDTRYEESQDIALDLSKEQRTKYTNKVSVESQKRIALVALPLPNFIKFVSPCARLFLKTFSEENVIPNWCGFCTDMAYHFYDASKDTGGENAQYIPILKDANPNKFGLAVCTIDGQRYTIGDSNSKFSLQSVSKPITYALGLEKEGETYMDEWIGVEPAGRPFNTQDLNENNCPFNSSVNSGAIMAAGVIASCFADLNWLEVVDKIRATWYKLCGNDNEIGFSQQTFDSEKATAYNNFAIAYNLKGRRGLPKDVDLHKMLDVYLGCCSIEITCEALSVAAATLANGGVCPITNKEIFPAHVTRMVLAEMMTCGMYDQAGRFAVDVGIPSKSGVSGALMVIVPNLLGFATFSPRLNSKGNSVRGISFCKKLVGSYRVHIFEPLRSGNTGAKIDPRVGGSKSERVELTRMSWAVEVGDNYALRLRSIFVFALCLTAAASPQGLSDHMVDAIKRNYQRIYQLDPNDKAVLEIIDIVKENPKSLRFLEELTDDTRYSYIIDFQRSIVLMSMIDIIFEDGDVGEIERNVAIRIAHLLGVDKSVADLEINRHAAAAAATTDRRNSSSSNHRRHLSRQRSIEFSEVIDADVSSSVQNSMIRSQQQQQQQCGGDNDDDDGEILPPMKKRLRKTASLGRGDDDAAKKKSSTTNTTLAEENLCLRREIFRLRRKVALLSGLLEDRPSK